MTGNSRQVILPQEMMKMLICCFSPGYLFYLDCLRASYFTVLDRLIRLNVSSHFHHLCIHYPHFFSQWESLKERILKALCLPSSPSIFGGGALFEHESSINKELLDCI